jgi:hypothetical protein
MEQHIGLGPDAYAISVDVYWPATKARQHFTDISKNQYVEIHEFASEFTQLKRQPFPLGKASLGTMDSKSSNAERNPK